MHVSELTRLEFMSALYRRYRNREIGQQDLADALNGFDQELQRFKVEPLGSVVLREAERLLREIRGETGLRTLDAMHLATFLLVKEEDWLFVASDQVLLKVAGELGVRVLDPAAII